jgi:hypothetical protein
MPPNSDAEADVALSRYALRLSPQALWRGQFGRETADRIQRTVGARPGQCQSSGDGIRTARRCLAVDAGFVEPVDGSCRKDDGIGAACGGYHPRRLGRRRSTAAGASADWSWRSGDRERYRLPFGCPTAESTFDAGERRLHRAWHAEPSALTQNQLELDPSLDFAEHARWIGHAQEFWAASARSAPSAQRS